MTDYEVRIDGKPINPTSLISFDDGQVLVKVRADLPSRSHVLEIAQLFRAKVVDVSTDAVTIEATGNADKLAALLRVLEPFGVRELVQSGLVAVGRGARSMSDRALRSA